VGEGVEDGETLELLRELGVDYAQGFHIGRPSPLEAAPQTPKLKEVGNDRRHLRVA
jgi:EAL domain-containing protein (putative c-di-GMP-specific phosphodiesterase class I)